MDSDRTFLVVVDMQNDFIDGPLGTPEAAAIVPCVIDRIVSFEGTVVCTLDTHGDDYHETREGRMLPVPHCIRGTPGWSMPDPVEAALTARGALCFEKPTFGSVALVWWLAQQNDEKPIDSIEVIGLCTDICVVSNALLIKAHFPEIPVRCEAALCAGVTPAAHDAALSTMRSCQVEVL